MSPRAGAEVCAVEEREAEFDINWLLVVEGRVSAALDIEADEALIFDVVLSWNSIIDFSVPDSDKLRFTEVPVTLSVVPPVVPIFDVDVYKILSIKVIGILDSTKTNRFYRWCYSRVGIRDG